MSQESQFRAHFNGLQVLKGVKTSLSSDVFSYGMVLFEIFKHEVPFAGVYEITIANMILEGKVDSYV